ncbi:hypothetical protein ACVMDO_002139 [Bradyrhizobium sp. USDA 4513]
MLRYWRDFREVNGRIAEQARDRDRCGLGIDIGRRRDLREPAVDQDRDAVGDRHRLAIVLGDVEHGGSAAPQQVRQLEPHLVAQLCVDIAQRIIQQQNIRIADQRPRQRRALLLSVRQFARRVTEHVLDLEQPADRGNAAGDIAAAGPDAQAACDIVAGGHVREQGKVLECHADPAPLGRSTDHRAAADQDVAVVGLEHARDHAQQHGLAAAGRSEHRHDLAGLDSQRQSVGGPCRTERLAHRIDFETRHRISLSPRRARDPRPDSAAHRAQATTSASPTARSPPRSGRTGYRTR